MKTILLPFALLISSPLALAETPSYLVKTSSSSSVTESTDAATIVTQAGQTAISYLEDGNLSEGEARDLISFLDLDRVARFTLGRYGRGLSEKEFSSFKTAFESYAVNQFRTHLSGFEGANIRILETIERRPNDVVVKTELDLGNGEVQGVNWRVMNRNDEWAVVDVEALGFWFAIEQRAQFETTLKSAGGDVSKLVDTLKDKSH